MSRAGTPDPVDISVGPVDTSMVTGDWQTLEVSGPVAVDIHNKGAQDIVEDFTVVFFEDLNLTRQS
jgi:hypothetical protein